MLQCKLQDVEIKVAHRNHYDSSDGYDYGDSWGFMGSCFCVVGLSVAPPPPPPLHRFSRQSPLVSSVPSLYQGEKVVQPQAESIHSLLKVAFRPA